MKCGIFDMDGTLINSEKKYFACWQSFMQCEGYALTTDFYRGVLGTPIDAIKPLFLAEYGSDFPFDTLLEQILRRRECFVANARFELNPGALTFLKACQTAGITCGLATSSPAAEAKSILEALEVWDYFTFTAFGDEVSKGKPDPEIFHLAAERSGHPKAEIVVFEDSTNGLLAAAGADLAVYHLNDFIPLAEEINQIPLGSYQDFDQLLAACQGHPELLTTN
ncbi:HAD family phosphatase [Enterococcus sp. 669A]|uniref:HAD family phosphatase n=1 Tax=Candidatus Enterococcus moelleringii TaxID=2815325 RepID=A0ABS3L4K9_9ENTE|nr:HAD family phosphatase [Enterococcus sp. 669A]MBO1304558.1 HAD family phosphatase [Enterococcus sp. 669A]